MSSRAPPQSGPLRRQPMGSSAERAQALREVRAFATRPRTLSFVGLWIFGLLAMFALPAPVTITEDKLHRYGNKLKEADAESSARLRANRAWQDAELATYNTKTWFWWANSQQRAVVGKAKAKERAAANAARGLNKQHEQLLSDAKAQLGLWSEVGLDEGRKLFWNSFNTGKVIGRRQTFWDSVFALLSGQDRNLAGALVQLIITAMVNFTLGMVISIFVFIAKLPGLIWSYQAGLFSALAFVLVAAVAAVSVILGFLGLLYGAGAGAVYGVASVMGPPRIGGGRRPHMQRMHYQRQHYE